MTNTTIGEEKYWVVKHMATEWLHVRLIRNYLSPELSLITSLLVLVSIARPQIDINMHIGVHTLHEVTIQGEYTDTWGKHGKFTVYD